MAAVMVAGALVAGACSGDDAGQPDATPDTAGEVTVDRPSSPDQAGPGAPVGPGGPVGTGTGTAGGPSTIGLRLSEGAPAPATPIEVVPGAPLDDAAVAAILDRLPDWDLPDDDRAEFRLPDQTLPPPLVGDTLDEPFPPPASAGTPTPPSDQPLEVLRIQPAGDVEVAPFLSVTFNQPMVALSTLEQLDAALGAGDVPVELIPAVPGRWRWIGTRTLRFEVEPGETDRLPQATDYRVEIPAGTTSANGSTLAEAVVEEFSTPPPTVETLFPESDALPLTPLFFLAFDQQVDPQAVLSTIVLDADGRRPLRLASDAEVAADADVADAVAGALPGRALVFRPVDPLPADTAVTLTIGPGTPSAEGPRTSGEEQRYSMRTYAPLRVVRHECGYDGRCEPLMPFTVEFNNPLDPATVTPERVTIEPALPGARVDVIDTTLTITGASAGSTTYEVTLDAAIADTFGQTLVEPTTLTFDVGPARPALYGLDRNFVTLDPNAERKGISVSTVNHDQIDVQVWSVTPDDYAGYTRYLEDLATNVDPPVPDWPTLLDTTIDVDAVQDRLVETFVDLGDELAASGGQLVVRVAPEPAVSPTSDDFWMNQPRTTWVQSTSLGVDALVSTRQLLIWTTHLATGEPVGGADVELLGAGRSVTTDADGLATVELSGTGVRGLVATAAGDTAMLPSGWFEGWTEQPSNDDTRWYVFDDRGVYRPGETARLAGWVRRFDDDVKQLAAVAPGTTVAYRVSDAQGNLLAEDEVGLNALGGFNFAVDVPQGANLGPAWVELELRGESSIDVPTSGYQFQIQEFRTPEFEVTARHESPGPYYAQEPTVVAVDATYYAGGPLADADVSWAVTSTTTQYSPPGHDEFTFGIWQPWWIETGGGFAGDVAFGASVDAAFPCIDCPPGGETTYEQFDGRTDAAGSNYLQIDVEGPELDQPATVTAEATVFDVNRQGWASRTDVLVHPATYYVGLRSDATFVERGTPLDVDAIVTDVDGELVAGREVAMEAGRLEWAYRDGEWSEELQDPQQCTVTSSTDPATCTFTTDVGGTYEITATVTDDAGRTNRTVFTRWVSGAELPPTRNVEQERITIVPDREEYAPGDTAELLVEAPFAPASGLVTVIRGGIESASTFDAPDGSAVLQIPIADDQIPNLTVQVDMTGSAERTADDGTPLQDAPRRPAFATGQIELSIPPVTRALDVEVTPEVAALEPGVDTSVTVSVRDASGAPVAGADVAVVVVDEAVLAVTGYELADPLDAFYRPISSEVFGEYLRSSIVLNRPDLLAAGGDGADAAATTEAPTDAGGAPVPATAEESASADVAEADRALAAPGGGEITVRSDFDALAVFAPAETTGPDGTVRVDVPLPDNLTRYRAMAVAVDGVDRFGEGESTITARLPLMVRPSAPRFLNFGDRLELPVVLQNQTDRPMDVEVALQTANLALTEGAGRAVTVPANDRVEVRFPATTDDAGTARLRIAAVSGDVADSAAIELPVYTPATTEAFATYGVIDEGATAQPIDAPTGVFEQFGGLEINTSSTALQALTDAVLYLTDYSYAGTDALASRIIAIAALRDVLEAFDAEGLPSPAEIEATMRGDIAQLVALQNDDGGWPAWRRGEESRPFASVAAAQALVSAADAGYDVPRSAIDNGLGWLRTIEDHIPAYYDETIRNTLSAYALNVRQQAGDRDPVKAQRLYDRAGDELELDALAWLWPVLDDPAADAEIERTFQNRAVETAGAATFAVDYGEEAYLLAYSDRRTDGIILDALISQRPDSDLIPKVVTGLLGSQVQGRWNNAYENSFILLALKAYFDTFEAVTPDFVARVWLGDTYAAEHEFRGRTTDRAATLVPISELSSSSGTEDVIVAKDGDGRLYYRLGMQYAPTDLDLDPRDEGFVVDRTYEPVDDPGDVVLGDDGVWRIRAGATVRVRLTMVADAARTNMALIDPLPAGLEPLNTALDVTTTPPPDPSEDPQTLADTWCWCWRWYEHENLRDDRAEAYATYLGAGTYEYTYEARATTPGEFVVPPAHAEELYAPEVFGRSASTRVTIVD